MIHIIIYTHEVLLCTGTGLVSHSLGSLFGVVKAEHCFRVKLFTLVHKDNKKNKPNNNI